jgi:hypothetical protein
MISSPLPSELEQRLRLELNQDEKMLWTGQPLASRSWNRSLPFLLFGIPWTAFSLFWMLIATGITAGAFSIGVPAPFSLLSLGFPLFGIPFILIGLWMLSSPFWMRRKAQKTVYALTDKRALILKPTWGQAVTVRSIPSQDLSARTRTQNADGSGTLIFTHLSTTQWQGGPNPRSYTVNVGFEDIPDVREVEALIDRTF